MTTDPTPTNTSDDEQATSTNPEPSPSADPTSLAPDHSTWSPTTTSQKHSKSAQVSASDLESTTKTHHSSQPKPTKETRPQSSEVDLESEAHQCELLKKIYDQLSGPNWYNQHGWSNVSDSSDQSMGDCCGYFGIRCDPENRVVSIDLGNNGLVGSLPAALFGLSSMIRL